MYKRQFQRQGDGVEDGLAHIGQGQHDEDDAYTVVLSMGYSWQMALLAVFGEGIVFIVLSLTNVREAIFNAIQMGRRDRLWAIPLALPALVSLSPCCTP